MLLKALLYDDAACPWSQFLHRNVENTCTKSDLPGHRNWDSHALLVSPMCDRQYNETLNRCQPVTGDGKPDHGLAFLRLVLEIVPTIAVRLHHFCTYSIPMGPLWCSSSHFLYCFFSLGGATACARTFSANWVTIVRANRATSKLPRGWPTGRCGAGTAGTSTVCTIPRTIPRQKSEISALWPLAAKRATAVSWGIT